MSNALKNTRLEQAIKEIAASINTEEGLKPEEYSEEDLFFLYNLAYKLYGADDYAKAEQVFRRLVVSKPFEVRYWQALGSCLQMQKKNENALVAWSMCALIDSDCPSYHLYAAQCLFAMDDKQEAAKALLMAENRTNDNCRYRGKIEALKEAWEINS